MWQQLHVVRITNKKFIYLFLGIADDVLSKNLFRFRCHYACIFRNYRNCPYYCECGDCWMDTEWEKRKEEKKEDGKPNAGGKLAVKMMLLSLTLMSVVAVLSF